MRLRNCRKYSLPLQKEGLMKEFREAVLIQKPQGILELISFFDTLSKTYGINVYFKNKLIEIIQPLSSEPKRYQMRNPWKFSKRYPWKYDITEQNNHKEKKKI